MIRDIQAIVNYNNRMRLKKENKDRRLYKKQKAARRRALQRALDAGLAYVPAGGTMEDIVFLSQG